MDTTKPTLDAPKVPVHSIPLVEIKVDKTRGRKDFKNIQELADDIKKNGLHHPCLVSRQGDGTYLLVAGERRLRAHYVAGLTHIDARFREDLTPLQEKEIELGENINRQDLTPLEKADLYRQIDELKKKLYGQGGPGQKAGWTTKQTAEYVGEDPSRVRKQIEVSRKLAARPDLVKRMENLPINKILDELAKVERSEQVADQIARGIIKVTQTLLLGDALELIKEVPEASQQLILTDPPFGIPTIEQYREGDREGNVSYLAQLRDSDNLTLDGTKKLMLGLVPELSRVLRPGGHFYIFTCYELYPFLTTIIPLHRLAFQQELLTWYKGRTTSPFLGYRYAPCSEPILYGWKPLESGGNGYGRQLNQPCKTLLEYPPPSIRSHPFEKPQDLLTFLITNSTFKGETILDPFAGSGSTLKAARSAGRQALGFEKDPEHWKLAQGELSK